MAQSVMMPSFSGGELSTNLYARVDLDKYHSGVATLRNFFVDYRGGVANRAGTKYIATCPTGTVRLIPFVVSRDQSYILLFSDLQILVYLRGTLVATVVSPYAAADIFQLRYVQSADVLTLAHPSYPVYNLNRTSATAFALVKETYGAGISAPNNPTCVATVSGTAMYYSYCATAINAHGEESLASQPSNVGSKALDPTAATPVTISLSWNSVSGAKVYNVYKAGPTPAGSAMPTVLGYIGQTKITDFVDNNIGPDFSQVPPDYRDPFSPGQITDVTLTAAGTGATNDYIGLTIAGAGTGAEVFAVTASGVAKGAVITRGGINYITATATPTSGTSTYTVTVDPDNHYPACVTYFQQRRCFAGADVSPDLIEMSKTGFYSNFDVSPAVLDSDAITINIASREVNNIEHMVPMSTGLVVFTRGNAFLVTGGGQSGAVTPTNIAATPQASTGAGPLPPLAVNNNILFQQYEGTVIRDMAFQWQTSSYFGTDRSMLANHLFFEQTLTDWAFASEPNHLLHVVREDGKMLAMAYVPEQEVYGWAQWDTQGEFISVASIPEDGQSAVYVVVKRHIANSSGDPCWVNYLERFATREDCCVFEDWFLDCATGLSVTVPDSPLYVSGLTGSITVTSYDPCVSPAPTDGPFITTSSGFFLEGRTSFGGTIATLIADSDATLQVAQTSREYMGHSYDPVTRRIYFSVGVIKNANGDDAIVNPSSHNVYVSGGSFIYDYTSGGFANPIGGGHLFDAESGMNFYLGYKDIDTDTVTLIDVFDDTAVIPNGIAGSDGTWRMMYDGKVFVDQQFKIVDPRSANVWSHATQPQCNLYLFESTHTYKQQLLPFPGPSQTIGGGGHMQLLGTNSLWTIIVASPNSRVAGSLYCLPRATTSDEIANGQLLAYFSNANADMSTTHYYATAWGTDGKLYFFGSARSGTRDYQLEVYTPPASVGSYSLATPPSGGTWNHSLAPWAALTGPNTSVASYVYNAVTSSGGVNNYDKNLLWNRNIILHLPATTQFALIAICEPQATTNAGTVHDPTLFKMSCTYYNYVSAAWDYRAWLTSGLMKADWTAAANLGEAAYAIQWVRQVNINTVMHDYDFTSTMGDQSYQWLCFSVQPVTAGVFTWDGTGASNKTVLAKYHFVSGAAPVLVTALFDSEWLSGYPAYAAAIGNNNIIEQSVRMRNEMDPNGSDWGSPAEYYLAETGIYDETTNSFWFGGSNNDSIHINTSLPTYRGTVSDTVQHPADAFVRLSFTSVVPNVAEGDVITVSADEGCGKITVTSVESAVALTGTVTSSWGGGTPGDSTIPLPIDSGYWGITTPTQIVSGLGYLEGKTVYALADGKVVGPLTVASGDVDLGFEASSVVVGLQYTSQFKTLRLDVGEPTIQGKRKIIQSLQLRVKCSIGFEVGTTDFSAIYQPKTNYPDFAGGPSAYTAYVQGGAAAIPFSGDVLVNVQAGWERDGVLTVQQSLPLPVTILGLIPEVTVGDNQR